jgi:MFS family permease
VKTPLAPDQRAGLFTITVTQFVLVFMLSSVAVAVPALGREFGAKASELGLVESGYIAAVSMLLFPVTRLADMVGRGAVFLSGIVVFTVVSLLLPLTTSIGAFIVLRVFQGAGGAMMVTTGLVILAELFPAQGRGRALGISSAGVYLGMSGGPMIGGLITTHLGWRWIFYICAVPCVACAVLALRHLPVRPKVTRGLRFDWGGAVLMGLGMMLLTQGGTHFDTALGKAMLGAALLTLAAFVVWEARADAPLLDLRLFAGNKPFAFASAVQFINYAAVFGITFLMSLYLQIARGMTAGDAGLVLMAQPLTQAVLSPLSGTVVDRVPPHRVATMGMGLGSLAMAMAALLGPGSPLPVVVGILLLCGAGMAIFATANVSVIMGSVAPTHYGVASAMTAAMRTTGMTFCLVVASIALSVALGPHPATAENAPQFLGAMRVVLLGFAALGAVGTVLSLYAPMRRPDAP